MAPVRSHDDDRVRRPRAPVMTEERQSLSSRIGRFDVIVLTSALWFLAKFVRFAFPPLFEQLASVYDVSAAVLGTAFSGLLLVYAALQFPSGLFADRFSSVAVIGAGGRSRPSERSRWPSTVRWSSSSAPC